MVATCERSPVTTRHTGKGTGVAKAEPLRTHYRRCRVWLIDTSSFTLTYLIGRILEKPDPPPGAIGKKSIRRTQPNRMEMNRNRPQRTDRQISTIRGHHGT